MAGLPPYTAQAVLRAEGRDRAVVEAFLSEVAHGLELQAGQLLGDPVGALPEKIAHIWRLQLLLEARQRPLLRELLQRVGELAENVAPRGIRWRLDVDPIDL